MGKFKKFLRHLVLKKFPSLFSKFFSNDFSSCGEIYDTIIIFDSSLTVYAANYIKHKYPQLRVIYWFWNHIKDPKILKHLYPEIEKWSYDPLDCKKYGLRYNTQFYFPELNDNIIIPIKTDTFFIGHIKKRENTISQCKNIFDKNRLQYNFIIRDEITRKTPYIPYRSTLSYIKETKCIVDILPDAQKGMSLRPLEALFFQKKLITNFTSIKDFDFYRPNNIFILGVDDEAKLGEFINSPYLPVEEDIIKNYSFKNWINRFT